MSENRVKQRLPVMQRQTEQHRQKKMLKAASDPAPRATDGRAKRRRKGMVEINTDRSRVRVPLN